MVKGYMDFWGNALGIGNFKELIREWGGNPDDPVAVLDLNLAFLKSILENMQNLGKKGLILKVYGTDKPLVITTDKDCDMGYIVCPRIERDEGSDI